MTPVSLPDQGGAGVVSFMPLECPLPHHPPMRPVLVVNPRSDEAFAALAHRLVRDGIQAASDVERELRRAYPTAEVHERALSDEGFVTWYVYREGTWIPSG